MAQPNAGRRARGLPLLGLGAILLALALGAVALLLAAGLAVFAIAGWRHVSGRAIAFDPIYMRAGLTAGLLALVVAAVAFAVLWLRRRRR